MRSVAEERGRLGWSLGRGSVWKTQGSGRTPVLEAEENVALAVSWDPTRVFEDIEDKIFIDFVYCYLLGA